MYEINVDKHHGIIQVKLTGMMSTAEVAAYIGDLKRQFVLNRIRNYALILDLAACPIQSQDMVRAMGRYMATMPKAEAISVVTGSSLARMQLRRLFKQPYARITATVAEGREWVLYGKEP